MNVSMENAAYVDLAKLRALGNLLQRGAGRNLLKFYEDALAGRSLVT